MMKCGVEFTEEAREQRCVIYMITHKDEGRSKYIGQAKSTAYQRFYSHKCRVLKGVRHPLYDAIRKFGFESFIVSVIEPCQPEELDDKEAKWIKELNTLHPNGYNLVEGGLEARRSDKARENMTNEKRGRPKHSPEARKRIGDACRGQPRPSIAAALRGRKLSEEHKEAIRRGNIGKHSGPRTPEEKAAIREGMSEEGKKRSALGSSLANSGPWSSERLEKYRASRALCKPQSDETRKKRSDSLKRYWQTLGNRS